MGTGYAIINPSLLKGNIGDDLIYYAINKFLAINDDISINLSTDDFVDSDTVEIINQSKALIICGTNLYEKRFNSGWGANLGLEYLKKIKKPIFIVGVGCNINFLRQKFYRRPFNILGKEGFEIIRYLHNTACSVSIRDDYTACLLEKHNIYRYSITGCPALYINSDFNTLQRKESKDYICFAFRNLSIQVIPKKEVYRFCRYTELFYRYFSKRCRVLICCHGETDLDLLPLSIPHKDVILFNTVGELLELYSHALLVIGARLHACVAAVSFNVPAALVIYDTRGLSFAEMFNLPYVRIGRKNYEEEMLEKCDYLLKNSMDLEFLVNKKRIYFERFKNDVLIPFNEVKYGQ